MSYFANKNHGEKIFRGAYQYTRNTNVYSEETFEVYRDKKELTFTFLSELISRVATGELLTINIKYVIGKDYIPQRVHIHRTLGNQQVEEFYEYDPRKTKINYRFKSKDEVHECSISTQPKFFITTSGTCMSMLYIRSKKFDMTAKNYYNIVTSKNLWEFKEEPTIKNIAVQRTSPTTENLKIGKDNLEAVQYRVTHRDDSKKDDEVKKTEGPKQGPRGRSNESKEEGVRIWCSQHMTIPYQIISNDESTKVQVQYLNNLDKDQ